MPSSVWSKALILNTMLEQQISQPELAKRVGTRKQEMQRIINLSQRTKIDTLAKVLEAMGKRLSISIG